MPEWKKHTRNQLVQNASGNTTNLSEGSNCRPAKTAPHSGKTDSALIRSFHRNAADTSKRLPIDLSHRSIGFSNHRYPAKPSNEDATIINAIKATT
jgi:hypothetical protein